MNAHLFVVGVLTGNAYRYTIINGGLPDHPDLEFTPAYSPTAVDAQGNYYVRKDESATGDILVYPHGSNHPARILQPSLQGAISFGPISLAVDESGYLYYGYAAQFPRGYAAGIYVFAPGASGNAQPVQSIKLGHGYPPNAAGGMALGPSGRLFVFGRTAHRPVIVVYSDFLSHPKVIRKIYPLGLSNPTGFAVGQSGETYITDLQSYGPLKNIAVYAAEATGLAKPARTMNVECLGGIDGGIVLLGNDAFAGDGYRNRIYEFDKRIPGIQNPIKFVSTPETPWDLSISRF